jgi:hypothetical protein
VRARWQDAECRFAWLLAGLALLAVVVAVLPAAWAPRCLLFSWTGTPCCACGGTRALRALLAGRAEEAFRLQPLLTLLAAGAAAWLGYAVAGPLFGWRRVRVMPGRGGRWLLIGVLAALLALNWWYLLTHLTR